MKEAIHVYYRAKQVHLKELKPHGRLRVYHPSIESMIRLARWLDLNRDKILLQEKTLGGATFVIERRER